MMVFSIGSIQEDTYAQFSPFPSHISGTPHFNLIMRKLRYIENYTSSSIGSVDIDDKYYQTLFDFTMASVLGVMQATDSSAASNVHIGDFSFGDKVGGGSDIDKAKAYFEVQAKEGLEAIKFMNWDTLMYKAV